MSRPNFRFRNSQMDACGRQSNGHSFHSGIATLWSGIMCIVYSVLCLQNLVVLLPPEVPLSLLATAPWPNMASDLTLESRNRRCLHDSLCRLGLHHDFLAEHQLLACFCGWLLPGLDHAEPWKNELLQASWKEQSARSKSCRNQMQLEPDQLPSLCVKSSNHEKGLESGSKSEWIYFFRFLDDIS